MNELVASLMFWVWFFTGYDRTIEQPTVVLKPHAYFVQRACNNIDTETFPCDYVGLYVYSERTIYIDEGLDKPMFDAVLVHELTHYMQHVNAMWAAGSCADRILRERQAYAVEQKYITEVQHSDRILYPPSDEENCHFGDH